MLSVFVFALAVFFVGALFGKARAYRRMWRRGHERHHHYGHRHYGHRPRGPLGWLFHELEVTPSQRSSLESAFRGFKDEARGIKSALFGGRHDLAEALRGEDLDVDLLGSTLAGGDETLDRARRAVANLTAEVHKILDPEQRERLADILERRGHSRFGWA